MHSQPPIPDATVILSELELPRGTRSTADAQADHATAICLLITLILFCCVVSVFGVLGFKQLTRAVIERQLAIEEREARLRRAEAEDRAEQARLETAQRAVAAPLRLGLGLARK